MKTKLAFQCSLLLCAGLAAGVPGAFPCLAQEAETAASIAPKAPDTSLISLDVRDGIILDLDGREIGVATVGSLARVIREQGWNVILAPGAENVRIGELRLRGADLRLVGLALSLASGHAVGGTVRSDDTALFIETRRRPTPRLEAFNISGYLGKFPPAERERALATVSQIAVDSLTKLERAAAPGGPDAIPAEDLPDFTLYPDAQILVVIGSNDAIEVVRKIINALPGQEPRK